MKEKKVIPQQYPGLRPPKGWVPPLDAILSLMGVYDSKNGVWVGLPIEAMVEALVQAEQVHITGILDGREESHDLATITTPLGALATYTDRKRLTVPSGEIWIVTCMEETIGVDPVPGAILTGNWRNSKWTDRSTTPDTDGQAFHAANQVGNVFAEFHPGAPFMAVTNKQTPLRLPGGTVITFHLANTGGVASAAITSTLQLYGYIGKILVP